MAERMKTEQKIHNVRKFKRTKFVIDIPSTESEYSSSDDDDGPAAAEQRKHGMNMVFPAGSNGGGECSGSGLKLTTVSSVKASESAPVKVSTRTAQEKHKSTTRKSGKKKKIPAAKRETKKKVDPMASVSAAMDDLKKFKEFLIKDFHYEGRIMLAKLKKDLKTLAAAETNPTRNNKGKHMMTTCQSSQQERTHSAGYLQTEPQENSSSSISLQDWLPKTQD